MIWPDKPVMNMLSARIESLLMEGRSKDAPPVERAEVLIQAAVQLLAAGQQDSNLFIQ